MNDIHFYDAGMLHLLWLLPLLALLYVLAARARKRALREFADPGLAELLNRSVSPTRRFLKAVLALTGLGFLAFSLARPAWDLRQEELTRRGRDVVFLLDVSRSMLANDLAPSRLDRAKLAILDAVAAFEGDRVGLVVFAGNAVVKCPLTLDYGFFRMMLEDASPESVSRGGTMIGDAVRKALSDVFDDQQRQFKDIVLITDGEDHESFPVEAARQAGRLGVRLIAIGLGDENVGKRIPLASGDGSVRFLTYRGREVWSKLDAATLREMAAATPGGRYLNVSTGAVDMADVYRKLIASAEGREVGSETIERFEEKFQIFLAAAFLLLCGELAIGERKPGV